MNIDEYRALKAQEDATKTEPETKPEETVVTPEVPVTPETPVVEEPVVPDKVIVDGEELTLEQIKEFKAGYSRTQDYTQKTQEAARIRRENAEAIQLYEYLKTNPKIAEAMLKSNEATPADIQQLSLLDPQVARTQQMERELNDMKLQKEIERMQSTYDDFDVMAVLQVAHEKRLNNLEDAYAIVRGQRVATPAATPAVATPETQAAAPSSPVDVDALRKQLRDEVLAELAKESSDVRTIISSGNTKAPESPKEIVLTAEEKAVADKMRLPYDAYAKWKNKK